MDTLGLILVILIAAPIGYACFKIGDKAAETILGKDKK